MVRFGVLRLVVLGLMALLFWVWSTFGACFGGELLILDIQLIFLLMVGLLDCLVWCWFAFWFADRICCFEYFGV